MTRHKLTGLGIALITPFKADGSVDYEALGKLLDYQLKNGADYFVVLGTTAETPTLSEDEKAKIIKLIAEKVNGRVPLVLGAGGNCTASVVEMVKNVDTKIIDAVLCVTPFYNKPSQEGLYQHYAAIAQASPVPVVLYNVPGRTGVNMNADTTLRLARQFKNIIAVKEASGNLIQISKVINNKPADFAVISGDDGLAFPLIAMGAVGVISVIGNAFPNEFGKMVRLALNGDYESARPIHHEFSELFSLLFVDGNPAGIKSMLSLMGFTENSIRLPLVSTTIKTFEEIKKVLDNLNVKC